MSDDKLTKINIPARRLRRRTHPRTSREAARQIVSELSHLHEQVYAIVHQYPGYTAMELARTTDSFDTRKIGRRLPELVEAGRIFRGRARRCKITGKSATTWWPDPQPGSYVAPEIVKPEAHEPEEEPEAEKPEAPASNDRCMACPRWKEGAKHIRIDGLTYDRLPDVRPSIFVLAPEVSSVEDKANRPVAGYIETALKEYVRWAGIELENVFFAAAVRCASNTTPKPGIKAIRGCRSHLDTDLAKIRPKVIIAIGATACKALNVSGGMNARGSIVRYTSGDTTYPVIPTHNPFAVKREASLLPQVREDFKRAKRIASGDLEAFSDETLKTLNLKLVETIPDLDVALDTMMTQPYVVIDTETRKLDPYLDPPSFLQVIQMAWSEKDAVAIPIHHPQGKLDLTVVQERLHRFLWDYRGTIITHNGKFDAAAVATFNKRPFKIGYDTMLANALISGASKSNSLKQMTWRAEISLGGYDEEADKLMKEADHDCSLVALGPLSQYGMLDAIATYRIAAIQRGKLEKMPRTTRLLSMLFKLSNVIVRSEITGIRIDWKYLKKYRRKLLADQERIETEIRELAGNDLPLTERDLAPEGKEVPFNFASTRYIAHLLYERMGLPAVIQTPAGKNSVSKEALTVLNHPIGDKLLELSRVNQNLKMYVRAYPKVRRGDHIHPTYHIVRQSDVSGAWGTVSGRTSVSNPNIQQLPRDDKSEVRKLILPDEGHALLADLDFMGIELRVAAMYCQDPLMVSFFNNDPKGDYHLFVAAEVFGKPKEEITKEQRSLAKNVNFALLYGAGPSKIASMTKNPLEEVESYMERYFDRFPGLLKWRGKVYADVLRDRFSVSLFGRKRLIPEAGSKDEEDRAYARRTGLNHKCQSAAADITFNAIVNIDRMLKKEKSKIRMMMTIHDSIVFSVPLNEVNLVEKIRQTMEVCDMPEVVKAGVKIGVDAKLGVNYGSLVPLEEALEELQ